MTNVGDDVEKLEPSYTTGGNVQKWRYLVQQSASKSQQLPYNPVIPTSDIYQREIKRHVQTKTCTQKFIAALFIMASTLKIT